MSERGAKRKRQEEEEQDCLVFHSKSADHVPGKGAHEKVARPGDYVALSKIKKWRERMSNFAHWHFARKMRNVKGNPTWTFDSVEAAFQAEKIALADEKKAQRFCAHGFGGHGWTGAEARGQRKLVRLNKEQLAQWDGMSADIMKELHEQRVQEDSVLSRILSLTGTARLLHLERIRGKPSNLVPFTVYEDARFAPK